MNGNHAYQPERWADDDAVQQLLHSMLAMPFADYSDAVAALVGDLRDAHVRSLFRILENKTTWKRVKGNSMGSKGFAFHVWLYHLAGGAARKLIPPPRQMADAGQLDWSRHLELAYHAVAARFEL
jgi:hypothetical protein